MLTSLLLAALALAPQARGRWVEKVYGSAGERLSYRLFLPERLDAAAGPPLVVMLHGCTQTAADFAAGTRMAELAERRGFLVAFPEQRPDAHPQRCWNWYDPAHQRRDAGEPARIAGLVRDILRDHRVDPRRVYIGGISAGGAMSFNVAAAYPELFAAVGVHSGIGYGAAGDLAQALRLMREGPSADGIAVEPLRRERGESARAVPLFLLHGAADPVVHPANAEAAASQWARAMTASLGTDPNRLPELRGSEGGRAFVRREIRAGTDGPILVESWVVEGLGHAWSGGSEEGSFADPGGPDASREMVRFFLEGPGSAGPLGGRRPLARKGTRLATDPGSD